MSCKKINGNVVRQAQLVADEMDRIDQMIIKNKNQDIKKLNFKFNALLFPDSVRFILHEIIIRFGAFKYNDTGSCITTVYRIKDQDINMNRIYTIEF